jgi:hypothetical protein
MKELTSKVYIPAILLFPFFKLLKEKDNGCTTVAFVAGNGPTRNSWTYGDAKVPN